MLITAIENFVLFSTLLALACFAVALAARGAARTGLWWPRPDTLARLYSYTLLIPPAAASWLVAAALLPEWWLGRDAFVAAHAAPRHELHLLGDLTAALEPGLAHATLLYAVAAALFATWSNLRGYLRVGGVINRLEMGASPAPPELLALVGRVSARHGLEVGLVMSEYPLSFVWGFLRSKLVLSSGLLRALTPEELAGVLEHEAAHHARRDNLFKLALALCGYASLAFPLSRLILRWRATEVEMVCDEVAAARTSAPLEIADALVKLRRRTVAGGAAALPAASSFVPEDAPNFERRVSRLIAFADAAPDPSQAAALSRANAGAAFLTAAALTLALLAVSLFMPLAVHHAAESLIRFFA